MNSGKNRPGIGIVEAAAGVTLHITNYRADRSRTIYSSKPLPDWVAQDPEDDPRERPVGFRSGLLTAHERLTAQRRSTRARTGMLRAMTDNVAALQAWRIR